MGVATIVSIFLLPGVVEQLGFVYDRSLRLLEIIKSKAQALNFTISNLAKLVR